MPGTQHPYVYALNNPVRYTDPSGEFVVEILGGAAAGAVIGAVSGGVSYALRNPGKSLGEYVRDTEFRRAVGTGAASGAVAGAVFAAVPLGLAALGLKAATAGGAAFIGWVSGSLAGAAGQITANLLTPCTPWHQNVPRAMFWGGLTGAAFGWAGWHVRQWWAARVKPVAEPLPPGWNERWEQMYGTRGHTPHWFDEVGGEWRWHAQDRWHPVGHWDYNPWTEWNSPWKNIYPGK